MEQTNGNQSTSRRTKIQMLELLSDYDVNPGMTVKDFCRLHKITVHTGMLTHHKLTHYSGMLTHL